MSRQPFAAFLPIRHCRALAAFRYVIALLPFSAAAAITFFH